MSIVDISDGVASAVVTTAEFSSYNSQKAELIDAGVRIFEPGASVAMDLEPEYIAISSDSGTAWITCQENNAIAVLDIANGSIMDIYPIGYKDHGLDENGSFDARSDDKGPEPEAVTVGEIDGAAYAFIGLERIGGIMVYDVSDPGAPVFAQYINNRDFTGDAEAGTAGDLGPEGLRFILTPNPAF